MPCRVLQGGGNGQGGTKQLEGSFYFFLAAGVDAARLTVLPPPPALKRHRAGRGARQPVGIQVRLVCSCPLCSGQVEGGSQQITSGPSHLDFNLDQQQHNTTTLSVTSPGACLRTQSIDFTDSVSAPKGRKIRPAADISGLLVESAICGVTLNTQNYAWASTLCSTLRNGFSGLSFSLLSS